MKVLDIENFLAENKENDVDDAIFDGADQDPVVMIVCGKLPAKIPRKLKAVVSVWAGVEKVLSYPTLPEDVPIYRVLDGGMSIQFREYVSYALLHFRWNFDLYRQSQCSNEWAPMPRRPEAKDYPVLVYGGYGRLGSGVVERLQTEGYPVDRKGRTSADNLKPLNYYRAIINILPCTAETIGMFNRNYFEQLSKDCVFVTVGRGKTVVHDDIVDALSSGRLRGCALDVFDPEPLPHDSPLWQMNNALITPHVSALSVQQDCRDEVRSIIQGIAVNDEKLLDQHRVYRDRGY